MRTIAIMNQKGGVGKTTTAVNLGDALARRGQRVLLVDLDPQSHLSLHLGHPADDGRPNIYHLLTEGKSIRECLWAAGDRLDMVASHIDLAAAEIELVSVVGREVILRDALRDVEGDYDFIIIDCPPSLGVLTLNGLCAAGEVFIPLQPHFLALQGMGKLLETIRLVASRINARLRVAGVVLCMYEAGTKLAAEVVEDLRGFLEASRSQDVPWREAVIFRSVIRRNIKLAESPSHGKSIFAYEPVCNGARDYDRLAGEVLGEAVATEAAEAIGQNADQAVCMDGRSPVPTSMPGDVFVSA